ncbi:Inter-alpha-trypsin inhibitor heavy chain C-terminal [Trinorchestia longiramus]|nr:Inter-alpha-trypsin inhibitor heavy chain C-terminal [Trinorchestia longiramus]
MPVIVYAGQLTTEEGPLDPAVKGVGFEGPTSLRVSRKHSSDPVPPNPDLQRVWAYLAVQDLLESQDLVDDPNLRSEMRARALHIALMVRDTRHFSCGEGQQGLQLWCTRISSLNSKTQGPTLLDLTPASFCKSCFNFPVDNDPHFVVQVPGLALPLCFDVHGRHGDVLSVIHDPKSGIRVSGEVTAAMGSSGTTYFTKLFVALRHVNVTVTPFAITVDCLRDGSTTGTPSVMSHTLPPSRRRRRHPHNARHLRSQHRHSRQDEPRPPLGYRHHRRHHRRYRRNRRPRRSVMNLSARYPHPQQHLISPAHPQPRPSAVHAHLHAASPLQEYSHKQLQLFGDPHPHYSTKPLPRAQFSPEPPQKFPPPGYFGFQASSDIHPAVSSDTNHLSMSDFHPHSSFDDHVQYSSHNNLHSSHEISSDSPSGHQPLPSNIHPHSSLDLHPHFPSSNNRLSDDAPPHLPKPQPRHMTYFSPSLATQHWNFSSLMKEIDEAVLSDEEREKLVNEIKYRFETLTSGSESTSNLRGSKQSRKDVIDDNKFTKVGTSVVNRSGSSSEELNSTTTTKSPRINSRYNLSPDTQAIIGNYTLEENELDGGSIYSDGEIHYRRTDSPVFAKRILAPTSQDQGISEDNKILDDLDEKCQQELAWGDISGRRFDDVIFKVKNNRKLNIMMGDLEVHFTITRTKNKHDQYFLGFYVEEQNVLSPLTTGIIGW